MADERLWRARVALAAIGIEYLGSNVDQAEAILATEMISREDRPPCWRRSWKPSDPACARCDHYGECADRTPHPATVLIPAEIRECPLCDGDLLVPLYDGHGQTIGWACSTPGCDGGSQTIP